MQFHTLIPSTIHPQKVSTSTSTEYIHIHRIHPHPQNISDRNRIFIYLIQNQQQMKSALLSSYSGFGKFMPQNQQKRNMKSIMLKQHYSHERPFQDCKFDIGGERIYLLDSSGALICVSLVDSSFSTLKGHKIVEFAIDGHNSYNLLLINKEGELVRTSLESKQSSRVMNLNMGKVLAFQRNYLRDMILVLDYKLLFLCDLANPSKIRSLKANPHETFTNACFATENRFLVLAVKNIEIRIIEILNLKTMHKLTLPFQVKDLKIEVSMDCKTIAIYGDCNIIFFIRIEESMELSYELMELPFLKSVRQLKFTYRNQIVFLGNDQVIYGISDQNYDKVAPIFNSQDRIRLMSFDITIDCKNMVIVSNRTIFTIHWKQGIQAAIHQNTNFKSIQFNKSTNINQPTNINQQRYQYDDEEEDSHPIPSHKFISFVQNKRLVNIPEIKDNLKESIHREIEDLQVSFTKKCHIQQIYKYCLQNLKYNQFLISSKKQSVFLIETIVSLTPKNSYLALEISFELFSQISTNLNLDDIEKYSLLFASEIIEPFEKKFKINFNKFFRREVHSAFLHLVPSSKHYEVINLLLKNSDRKQFFILFFLELLKSLHENQSSEKEGNNLQIQKMSKEVIEILNSKKYEYAFAKPHESLIQSNLQLQGHKPFGKAQTLEELIAKQEEINQALSSINAT